MLYRQAGNPFNTTFIPSSPASPPSQSPTGAPPPEEFPTIQPNEPAAPENSHSSKSQKFLTTKRVVWTAIAALIIVIVLVLGLWLFMSSCCKGSPVSKKVPKRREMDVDYGPKDNPKQNMTLLKPYSHNGEGILDIHLIFFL